MEIRTPTECEYDAVAAVHAAAFPTDLEARLVRLLIGRGKATISLAAFVEGTIVGHILFSPATFENGDGVAEGLGLAPLAVLPEFQRRGIGGELVRAGLRECQRSQTPWAMVLGEPGYYGRFGFLPAANLGLSGEFGGGDAFQLLAFDRGRLPTAGGHVRYAGEFHEVFGDES